MSKRSYEWLLHLFIALWCILMVVVAYRIVGATPVDDGQYQVSYYQNDSGRWVMNLSENHPNEVYRLGSPAELAQDFTCQHEAVNHFYFLFGRLYGFTLSPFPAPPGGC